MTKPALAVSAAIAAALAAVAMPAAAQQPTARFSSPPTAVAGAPVWIRSVDPCPIVAGAYQYVVAGFTPQIVPEGEPAGTVSDSTTADLRADGSWEVTVSAPEDAEQGVTKSYSVQADCVVVADPYQVTAEGEAEGGGERVLSIQRYALRPVLVTGFGAGEAAEPVAPTATTSTTVAVTTTTLAVTTVPTLPVPTTLAAQAAAAPAPVESPAERKARIDAIRDELQAQGIDEASMSDREVLLSEVAASAVRDEVPGDGGIPWWAFALAAVLAVGSVVAFGTRRSVIG